jgi:hypothetical protein
MRSAHRTRAGEKCRSQLETYQRQVRTLEKHLECAGMVYTSIFRFFLLEFYLWILAGGFHFVWEEQVELLSVEKPAEEEHAAERAGA